MDELDMQMEQYREAQDMILEMRNARRRKHRLAYDCQHLKVHGDRASCELGKPLTTAKDRSLAMDTLLRGYTPKVCLWCKDFVGDMEPE